MFIETVYGCERFGWFVPSLASVFNIVHTFVCRDDAGPSTTNANESIPDGAVNVNSETKALTCAKFSAYVENIFYLYTEAFAGRESFESFDAFCRNKVCVVLVRFS